MDNTINKLTEVSSDIATVRKIVKDWKKQGFTVGLVPTMGALHIGHESLIKKAKESCDKVIVSIFVNPIQFGPTEDYSRYPRQMDKDRETCSKLGTDLIFTPSDDEMYPDREFLTKVCPSEHLQNKLCGKTRIGHFDGVATVVTKLFNIVQPDKAFFGQKDLQQLIILKKMCKDLDMPIEIIPCPIIRDPDGLACSSRNSYLTPEARQKALSLSRALNMAKELYASGLKSENEVLIKVKQSLDKDIELEYLEINDLETLKPLNAIRHGSLIAIAARVNGVRLIDNVIIN